MESISNDIWSLIEKHLSVRDVVAVSSTCKALNDIVNECNLTNLYLMYKRPTEYAYIPSQWFNNMVPIWIMSGAYKIVIRPNLVEAHTKDMIYIIYMSIYGLDIDFFWKFIKNKHHKSIEIRGCNICINRIRAKHVILYQCSWDKIWIDSNDVTISDCEGRLSYAFYKSVAMHCKMKNMYLHGSYVHSEFSFRLQPKVIPETSWLTTRVCILPNM